jgi:hypothetical protein
MFVELCTLKIIVWTPLNDEQCLVRSAYSMIMHQETSQLIYATAQINLLRGNFREEGEREKERKEKE